MLARGCSILGVRGCVSHRGFAKGSSGKYALKSKQYPDGRVLECQLESLAESEEPLKVLSRRMMS